TAHGAVSTYAGGRRGKERGRAQRGSSDWRRGAAGSPDPDDLVAWAAGSPEPYMGTVPVRSRAHSVPNEIGLADRQLDRGLDPGVHGSECAAWRRRGGDVGHQRYA